MRLIPLKSDPLGGSAIVFLPFQARHVTVSESPGAQIDRGKRRLKALCRGAGMDACSAIGENDEGVAGEGRRFARVYETMLQRGTGGVDFSQHSFSRIPTYNPTIYCFAGKASSYLDISYAHYLRLSLYTPIFIDRKIISADTSICSSCNLESFHFSTYPSCL